MKRERERERERSECVYLFIYFLFKKSLLSTVDVNTVCVEGLNWSFLTSCRCV